MNLYLRLIYAVCLGLLRRRLDHRDHLHSNFRVWPHDLDAFGHMNNGRYLQIMDVGRAEWMARVGVLECMWGQRWTAVIGGGFVRFRRSLKPFERYQVRTRLLSWDARWWYLEHAFIDVRGRQIATGVSRAALRDGTDWVATEAVVELIEPDASAPPLPDYVRSWLKAENEMWYQSVAAKTPEAAPALAIDAPLEAGP